MYTALHFNAELKDDVPWEVVRTLQAMTKGQRTSGPLPEHELFQTDRWQFMLVCDSYSFVAETHSVLMEDPIVGYQLSVTCSFKNYHNEVALFLDWIMPHVNALPGDWLGYHMYEEDERPTLIYYPAPP